MNNKSDLCGELRGEKALTSVASTRLSGGADLADDFNEVLCRAVDVSLDLIHANDHLAELDLDAAPDALLGGPRQVVGELLSVGDH